LSYLLVDDRDGRIVAELETEDHVLRVLEAMASDEPSLPDYLCVVEMRSNHGSVVGSDSCIKIRTLH
jgi:hypothetical protein